MQQGPSRNNSSSTDPLHFHYTHTFYSKLIGATFGAIAEQGVFHPVDTAAKTAMANKTKTLPWLRALVAKEGMLSATKQLYGGFMLGVAKKAPMRSYKYGVQDHLNEVLSKQYGEAANIWFGAYGNVIIQATAGATTGALEPFLLFQLVDTMQVRKQVLKEPITFENAKKLGFRNLSRATIVTGFARNVPGSIGLFGGSELANQLMNNKDHESNGKNLLSKWIGALFSLGFSQPGDVIKTDMQTKLISFGEALNGVTMKQLFSSGLTTRLALSGKIGFGFLVIEKGMHYSKQLFGERVEVPKKSSRIMESSREVEDDTNIRDEILSNSSPTLLNSFNANGVDEASSGSRLVEEDDNIVVDNDEFVEDLRKALKKSKI